MASGDTIIPVDNSSGFSAGDKIIFQDGTEDFKTIDSVTAESIILTQALTRGHSAGTQVGLENLATRVSANNYEYALSSDDLKSSGVHKIKWRIVRSGVSTFINQSLTVYRQYIDEGTFFDTYPELETDFGDYFDINERIIRQTIDTVCGQSFEYYPDKSLTLDGSGYNKLHLPIRIQNLLGVTLLPNEDITSLVKIQNASRFAISS